MSANVEEDIQRKVHRLRDEQQLAVLKFVEGLEQSRGEASRALTRVNDQEEKAVDLREQGISREQAAQLRATLATFEDWNDPEMEIYDDYDQNLAALNQNL
jgi:hypothetical protein